MYAIPAAKYLVEKVVALARAGESSGLRENSELNGRLTTRLISHPYGITEFQIQLCLFLAKILLAEAPKLALIRRGLNAFEEKRVCICCIGIYTRRADLSRGSIHIRIDVDGAEKDVCDSLFEEHLIWQISSLHIELNQAINQHRVLIEKLCQAGFGFDTQQVDKVLRREPTSSGFAEYVFRRKIHCNFASELRIKNLKGTNSFDRSLKTGVIKETDLVNPFHYCIPLSRFPASFALKEIWDVNTISSIGHQVAQLAISENAEAQQFDSVRKSSTGTELRQKVSKSLFSKCSEHYLRELEKSVSGFAFSGHLAQIFLNSIFTAENSSRFTSRV